MVIKFSHDTPSLTQGDSLLSMSPQPTFFHLLKFSQAPIKSCLPLPQPKGSCQASGARQPWIWLSPWLRRTVWCRQPLWDSASPTVKKLIVLASCDFSGRNNVKFLAHVPHSSSLTTNVNSWCLGDASLLGCPAALCLLFTGLLCITLQILSLQDAAAFH